MFKYFNVVFFCICFSVCSNNYSTTQSHTKHDFTSMSCKNLMLGLIEESSFHKILNDKTMALDFNFERSDENHIMITFVRRAGIGKGLIYANFELDLIKRTLMIIDPDPPIPIKINIEYIPFIADKCTPDENVYANTGKLPDTEFDGKD